MAGVRPYRGDRSGGDIRRICRFWTMPNPACGVFRGPPCVFPGRVCACAHKSLFLKHLIAPTSFSLPPPPPSFSTFFQVFLSRSGRLKNQFQLMRSPPPMGVYCQNIALIAFCVAPRLGLTLPNKTFVFRSIQNRGCCLLWQLARRGCTSMWHSHTLRFYILRALMYWPRHDWCDDVFFFPALRTQQRG